MALIPQKGSDEQATQEILRVAHQAMSALEQSLAQISRKVKRTGRSEVVAALGGLKAAELQQFYNDARKLVKDHSGTDIADLPVDPPPEG